MSKHIGLVHKNYNHENYKTQGDNLFDRNFVKDYIAMCKKGIEEVTLTERVHEVITQYYIEMRKE